ncbi:VOC family protein, partial [Staphylococcus aureus]
MCIRDRLVSGKTTAYFNIGGLWVALNEEKDIPRNEVQYSYTHVAFTIDESEFNDWYQWFKENDVNILEGRTLSLIHISEPTRIRCIS